MLKKNNLWLGLALGLLLPLAAYYGIELLSGMSPKPVFDENTHRVISIVMNVFLFRQYMLKWDKVETGRGMLLATFVYAILFVIFF